MPGSWTGRVRGEEVILLYKGNKEGKDSEQFAVSSGEARVENVESRRDLTFHGYDFDTTAAGFLLRDKK
jgi:hypothetical protein